MKEFTPTSFAAHLNELADDMPSLQLEMLEVIGISVEKAARDKIGEYQGAAGPFREWASLAESTKASRIQAGYPANEPLLVTGELRASITHRVTPPIVEIGSNDPIAEYQEFGTAGPDGKQRIPPRSFLGGAAFEQAPVLVEALGKEMETYLAGTRKAK